MSGQVLASQSQPPMTRPSANYTPSVWGDQFLSCTHVDVDSDLLQQLQEHKREVKMMLMVPVKEASEKLNLVDDIQRLGVSYHFEKEIAQILEEVYLNTSGNNIETDDDLCTTALRFRLFRQQGYNVSADIFNKFKERNHQKFKEALHSDVAGLLSLYEAAHLRIHGEDILEEALTFTTAHLESLQHSLSPSLSKQVRHSLNQPLRKGIPRVEARYYLSSYHKRESHNATLLTFAKLDFNMLQKVHQNELCEITRWWKTFDVKNKMSFTRDRITEIYFIWVLSVYFEPQFSFARRTSCKVTALMSIIDDIYDNHTGTLEELELFTEAIQRWDMCATDPLPACMKVCYKGMLEVYSEIEEELVKEGKSYRIHYAIEAMKRQAKNYFNEAKSVHQKLIPTMDEYMNLSLPSTAYHTLIETCFVGMGDIATHDSFEWLATYPKAIKGAEVVCRLMDDIVDYKFDMERGSNTSAVECYMIENDATEEEAIAALRRKISDAWKDINESFFLSNAPSRSLLTRILNFACAMDVAYKCEDGYTSHHESILKDFIVATIVESVPL